MNTFERVFEQFDGFTKMILNWQPDVVVPVAKKGGKLLRLTESIPADLVRYKSFYLLEPERLHGKRVAVVDDATQYTATLRDYRDFFEELGATVRTFSFVGHDRLASRNEVPEQWYESSRTRHAS